MTATFWKYKNLNTKNHRIISSTRHNHSSQSVFPTHSSSWQSFSSSLKLMGDYFLEVLPFSLWVFDSAPPCAPWVCSPLPPSPAPSHPLSSWHWDFLNPPTTPPLFVFHPLVRIIISRLSEQFESLPSKLKFPECVRSGDTPWVILLTRRTLSFENTHILSPGPITSALFHRFMHVSCHLSSHDTGPATGF